jgi:hypothetical protein
MKFQILIYMFLIFSCSKREPTVLKKRSTKKKSTTSKSKVINKKIKKVDLYKLETKCLTFDFSKEVSICNRDGDKQFLEIYNGCIDHGLVSCCKFINLYDNLKRKEEVFVEEKMCKQNGLVQFDLLEENECKNVNKRKKYINNLKNHCKLNHLNACHFLADKLYLPLFKKNKTPESLDLFLKIITHSCKNNHQNSCLFFLYDFDDLWTKYRRKKELKPILQKYQDFFETIAREDCYMLNQISGGQCHEWVNYNIVKYFHDVKTKNYNNIKLLDLIKGVLMTGDDPDYYWPIIRTIYKKTKNYKLKKACKLTLKRDKKEKQKIIKTWRKRAKYLRIYKGKLTIQSCLGGYWQKWMRKVFNDKYKIIKSKKRGSQK